MLPLFFSGFRAVSVSSGAPPTPGAAGICLSAEKCRSLASLGMTGTFAPDDRDLRSGSVLREAHQLVRDGHLAAPNDIRGAWALGRESLAMAHDSQALEHIRHALRA